MYLFITVLLSIKTIATASVGSTLFYNKHCRDCWSKDELAKLRARRLFEQLIPSSVSPDQIDGRYADDIHKYFRRTLYATVKDVDNSTGTLLQEALSDAIGGHLRHEILPSMRLAYYAGNVKFHKANQMEKLYNEIKIGLNTQGIGWKRAPRVPYFKNLTVEKILLGSGSFFGSCSGLITKRDTNSCIHLPLPKLDSEVEPSAIALPFSNGGLVSLTSPDAENAVLKYYTIASRCILGSSPDKCRHTDFVAFNNEMWHWMKRDVAPHLVDEQLYAAYGGILRVAAAVQNYGKGLTRPNLFDDTKYRIRKWYPWMQFQDNCVKVNVDWSPMVYVAIVLAAALAVFVIQMLYARLCPSGDRCGCRSYANSGESRVSYANVESHFPAMISPQNSPVYSDRRPSKSNLHQTISARTQKVYDLNENKVEYMDVVTSDVESATESSGSKTGSGSAPRLDTPLTELRPGSRGGSRGGSRSRAVSVSSTYSSSSSSRCSAASCARLAWAHHVANRASLKSKSISDFDLNSFTTPPSKR